MNDPTRGPIFACLYPGLCDIARRNGYALAIHGTLVNDMDLIAVPWTAEAIPANDLKDALMDFIGALGYADFLRRDCPHLTDDHISQVVRNQGCIDEDGAHAKPHGRIAWNLYLQAGTKIDLSVMPLRPKGWQCDLGNGEFDHDWQESHETSGEVDGGRGDEWTTRTCRACGACGVIQENDEMRDGERKTSANTTTNL